MSKVFYDHLIDFSEIDDILKSSIDSYEEKVEFWKIIDEIIHHRVIGCILDKLDTEDHYEFLDKFYNSPYNEELITYINLKIDDKIEKVIKKEIELLKKEIIEDLNIKRINKKSLGKK